MIRRSIPKGPKVWNSSDVPCCGTYVVVRWHSDWGVFNALVKVGRKWLQVVRVHTYPLTVDKINQDQWRYMHQLGWPVEPFATRLWDVGVRNGQTKQCMALLEAARNES